jgi:hypothetical protein
LAKSFIAVRIIVPSGCPEPGLASYTFY